MKYRDALNASKGCPKCCSKTLDRFMKNTPAEEASIETKPEKAAPQMAADSKALTRTGRFAKK